MFQCPKCSGTQLQRSRRRGVGDNVFASAGYWPYRCQQCSARFRLPARDYSGAGRKREPEKLASAAPPEIESYRHPDRPIAKVVIQADSHEQLDRVLLALERAVAQQDESSRTAEPEFVKYY